MAISNNNDRKGHCSLCEDNVNDFTRHNREHHIKNPGELWICPYVECSLSWHTFRDGTVTIDEHLANAHQDFRHKKGQAGAFLWRIPTMGTVKHLNSAALKHIARHHHGLIKNYIDARNDALDHLMLRQLPDPGLAALPASAIRIPHADVTDKAVFPNKGVIWKYLIKLRSHIALWDDAINMAKSMIEEDAGKLLDMHIAQPMPLQNGQDYAMPVAEPMPMENEQIQDMFMVQPMPFLNSQGYAMPMAEPMSLENAQVQDMFMGQQMLIQNYQDYAIQMPEPMHVEDGQAHGMFVPDAEMNPEFYGFDIDADADMDLGF